MGWDRENQRGGDADPDADNAIVNADNDDDDNADDDNADDDNADAEILLPLPRETEWKRNI